MPDFPYCETFVREQDRDRYLCAVCMPPVVRGRWCAVFAFDIEIRSIAAKTGEELVGFVRYAWWREAVGNMGNVTPAPHPVLAALAEFAVPKDALIAIIDAHQQALVEKKTCIEASVLLLRLCAQVAGVQDADCAALGAAWEAMEDARHAHAQLPPLTQKPSKDSPLWPFAAVIRFYQKRFARGNFRHSLFLLPLHLWMGRR